MADNNLLRRNEQQLGLDAIDAMRQLPVAPSKEEVALERDQIIEDTENVQQKIDGAALIMDNQDVAEEAIQDGVNRGQISRNTARELKDSVRNQEVGDILLSGDEKEVKGGSKSPKESFMSTLALFLPTIIGGLAGAALEGSAGLQAGLQGGLAGSQAGANLVQGIETTRLKQGKLKAETDVLNAKLKSGGIGTKVQQTEFTDSDGNPIVLNPASNQFIKVDGTRAKDGDFIDPKTARQAKQIIQSNKRLAQNQLKIDHGIKKDAQLSDKQASVLKDLTAVDESLSRVEKLSKEVTTGFASGRFQSFLEIADAAPEQFTELKTETASLLSNYTKSISGAQVADAEIKRLNAVAPSVNDGPRKFAAKTRAFKRIIEANRGAFRRSIETGQPLKMSTIKGLDQAEKDIEGITEEGAKSTEIKRVTADGRIAIFDENKKFLRFE